MSSTEATAGGRVQWAAAAERGLRTLAPITVAAVGLSVLVGGVGGRLAMSLLSVTNPDNDGRLSDDGFVIGRFDLGGTVQLLAFSLQIGLVATACYLVARHLVIGPRWFQVTSMAVGAGTVVGALLIDPEGIDFTAFDPPLLPIVLFLAIPIVYVACLAVVAERLVGSAWAQVDRRAVVGTDGIRAVGDRRSDADPADGRGRDLGDLAGGRRHGDRLRDPQPGGAVVGQGGPGVDLRRGCHQPRRRRLRPGLSSLLTP